MLKNKIIVRKIRNIMILLMVLIIMLGAYSNIRRSKAENVIEIVLEAIDKDELLEPQIMTIEAKENEDGEYTFNLPKIVNNFIIDKYYLDAENEIVENEIAKDSNAENATSEIVESSNAENATNEMAESANAKNEASDVTEVDMNNAGTSKTIKLTSEEITSKSVQLTISYDKKESTKLNGTETTVLYNKELKSLGDEAGNGEGEVIVTGYMPADAKLEIKDIDLAKLTSVKLENENQTLQKAYEISIYQMVEKQNAEDEQNLVSTNNAENVENIQTLDDIETENTNATQEENAETAENTNVIQEENAETAENTNVMQEENAETERIEYNASTYGETITVKTKYEQSNVIATIYVLGDNNELTKIENTTVKSEARQDTNDVNETIEFESEKTDRALKYILATEEKQDNTDNADGTINEDDTNNADNEDYNEIIGNDGDTTGNETITPKNEIENSKWQVIESTPDLTNNSAIVKIQGPEDILTEEWVNVIINGEIVDEGINKEITEKNKTSGGIEYTIELTELPDAINQIKIGIVNPNSMGVQTFSEQVSEIQADEIDNDLAQADTTEDIISDDSDIMLLATTYNALKATSSETASDSAFLGSSNVKRNNISGVIFKNGNGIGRGLRRNFNAQRNTSGTSHSTNTTTWTDLVGTGKDGTLNGGTWNKLYLQLDGEDDWVNLDTLTFTTGVTLDVSVSFDAVSDMNGQILCNYNSGGVGISFNSEAIPKFTAYIDGVGYVHAIAPEENKLNAGQKYRLTGTYDGSKLCFYIDGKLVASKTQAGTIKQSEKGDGKSTVMALGTNPYGTGVQSGASYVKMKVYSVKVHNVGLTAAEVAAASEIVYSWDVSAAQDGSIMGWTSYLDSIFTVFIGSTSTIYANANSSYLFAHIGYDSKSVSATVIANIGYLDTSQATNMSYMFYNCGRVKMSKLDLGSNFDTSKVTNMAHMFDATGWAEMTSLNLGSKFNTSNVTNMDHMFAWTGQNKMTTFNLGNLFNTSKVTNMESMFRLTGYEVLTSLSLGNLFYTTSATNMTEMFLNTGCQSLTSLDLGPAFTKIASTNTDMFAGAGKQGEAIIYAPEAIYKSKSSFKLSSGDTSTTISPTSGTTVEVKYKPEWTVTGTTVDTANKTFEITLKGATNSNYTSNVTTALKASDISVWIDGTQLTGIDTSVSTANPATGENVTHTITLTNFEEALRQEGKSYKEWSGNITLKIAGRNGDSSTYNKKVLVDSYGNQSMSAIDTTGTWVDIQFNDSTYSTANTSGKLFADVIKPEIKYTYSESDINQTNKTVKVVFSVTDKYFSNSTLTANDLTILVDGENPGSAITKTLTSTDITATVDGTSKTVGKTYTLTLSNLEQTSIASGKNYLDYSGIITVAIPAGKITDTSSNSNDAKTLTIGINETGETNSEIIKTGLVRYYDAKNNTGSGYNSSATTWKDLSGNTDATLNGGTWSSNGYLTLDGTDDWVNLGQVSLTSEATLEATVTPITIGTSTQCIVGNWNGGGGGIYISGKGYFTVQFYINGAWKTCTSTVAPAVGETYNVATTYDGSTIKIYINGELNTSLDASGTIGTPSNSTVMAIGCNTYGSTSSDGGFTNCNIHTVRIYNKVLTQGQILNNISATEAPSYIPEGYSHVEGTLYTGYVIEDSNGNQFVWVEVPQTTTVYPTAGLSITEFTDKELTKIENDLHTYTTTYRNSTSFADTWYSEDATGLTKEEYNTQKKKMLKSIYMYGGFYVGRYETGTTTGRTSASTLTTPVIKQNMYPYNYITNIQAQELSENFSSTGYIGSLMYGVQWDLILKYLETKGAATQAELITNSGSWGNFYDSSWSVTNTSSKYWTSGNGWTSGAYGSKSASTRVVLSTGATDSFKKMNIYDLAGNVWEMTLEYTASASKPVAIRGGGDWSDGDDCPVYYRGKGYADGDQNANIRI